MLVMLQISAVISSLTDFFTRNLLLDEVGRRALTALTPFFEDGAFQAPVIDRVIPLSEGSSAYAQVAHGEARGRLVLAP
jgi:NADPH:quinone reductase-like Zn-dependent oxidoreductase